MPSHRQRDQAQQIANHQRDGERNDQREPRRPTILRGKYRCRVGAQTDKRRLSKTYLTSDTGEQNEAQRYETVKPNVVEQSHVKRRREERRNNEERNNREHQYSRCRKRLQLTLPRDA